MVIKYYGAGVKLLGYDEEEPLIIEKGEQTFTPTDYGGGVVKLTPTLGTQAKAVGGATIPKPEPPTGVSQRMRGIGEVPKDFKLEAPLAKLPETGKKIVQMLGGLQGFKATEPELYKQIDTISKQINEQPDQISRIAKAHELLTGEPIEQSIKEISTPTLQPQRVYARGVQAVKLPEKFNEAQGLAQQATQFTTSGKIGDVMQTVAQGVVIGYLVTIGLKGLYQSGLRVGDKWISGKKLEEAMARAQKAYITETGKFKATLSNNDLAIAKAVQRIVRSSGVKAGEITGVKVPQLGFLGQVGGVPNIVKMIQQRGITPEVVSQLKTLSSAERIQVTQQLQNIAPALASEVLKAIEKVEAPKVYKGKAYRAETHIPEHGAGIIGRMNTAQEKLDYDYGTTGNYIFKEAGKKAEELNIDLNKVPITEMIWVAPELETAKKYGEAEEYKLPEDTIVLAEDNEGGSLVLKNSGNYIDDVGTEPIPEGGVPPTTVDKQNSIFNKAAKRVEDIATKAIQVVDIQAPFNKLNARETGFQIKNYYSNIGLAHQQGLDEIRKLNKINVRPVTVEGSGFKASGQLDYTDVTYLSERPGYFVKLTPEERKIASVAKKSIKDYYKGWEGKLKEIGWMEEPFPQSFITRAQNRMGGIRKQLKDVKKPEDKQILLDEMKKLNKQIERIKKQKLQFVSIPAKTILSNAETNPEIYKRIMSILPKWDRATLTVKDLVDAKVITRKEADIRYIIGEYSDRMGKKYALGKIFENAEKEGLIKPQALVPNWLPARIYINGKYVDIPQLRGKRLEPFFSDTVTDFFSKNMVMMGPIMGTIKMMQFYNPLIMPMYDVWQAAAAGVYLNPVKGFEYIFNGIRDVIKHTDKYYLGFENGLFSKPYTIPYDVFERQFKEVMQGSKLVSTLKKAALPTNWLPMLYNASWSTAWTLDPMVRMMSFNYLLDKGMSPRNAAQLAALFHSDYASVPPATRRTLNKIFFTPTFKITMAKLLGGMFKGVGKIMAKYPAKFLFGKDIKIYPKDKILARGALIALGIMLGVRQYFKSQGYKEENLFWKYSKQVETDEGMKENVITLSHPFNIPFRYYGRIRNAWAPSNLNVVEKLIETAKWDLHPVWRVAYDIAMNENFSIYNPFDNKDKIARDIALYAFTEFVAITKGILESAEAGKISAENFKILQKDMGKFQAIILRPFIYNYTRDPRKTKAMRDIKRLQKEFSFMQLVDPAKNPELNHERMENFKNRVTEILDSLKEKEVVPKTERQETFTGGVRLLETEKDYGGGVRLLETEKDYGGGVKLLEKKEEPTISPQQEKTSRESAILGLMKQGVIDPDIILNYLNYDQQGNKVGDFTPEEIKQLQPKTIKIPENLKSTAEKLTGIKLKDRNIPYVSIPLNQQIQGIPLGQQNKDTIVINSNIIDSPAGETLESSIIHELMHTILYQNGLDKTISKDELEAIIKDSEYYYLAGGKGIAPAFKRLQLNK